MFLVHLFKEFPLLNSPNLLRICVLRAGRLLAAVHSFSKFGGLTETPCPLR
uniref:Uncharacterized protein n=1 Tax=Arundo donax TaxID=35708 RepID=A0A0A9C7W4_ARUDO